MLAKLIALLCLFILIVELPTLLQADEQNPIRVVVFDFSGVIAKIDKRELASFIAHSLQISKKDARHTIRKLKRNIQQGETEEDFWSIYANSERIILPNQWIEKLNGARIHALKEISGMVDIVKELQRHGYQTALLSNAGEWATALRRRSSFYQLFHPALFSFEIGVEKPNREIYEILLNQLQVPPQAILFIDNKPRNIKAAKPLGIDGIIFIDTDQLIEELKERGIKEMKVASLQNDFTDFAEDLCPLWS